MIVHLPPNSSSFLKDVVSSPNVIVTTFPNRERSLNALTNRLDAGAACSLIDLEWHSPANSEEAWVTEWLGGERLDLQESTADRRAALDEVATLTSGGIVLAPGGRPDQLGDASSYANELWNATGRPIWATMAINRQSLADFSVLMQSNRLHRAIEGFYLVVIDSSQFPSNWGSNELESYLDIIATQVQAGRVTVAAHSDIRGLMAVALGATHLGTGLSKAMRQYGAPTQGGGGVPGVAPTPTQSYTSLPLMGVLHGARAQAILSTSELRTVESHGSCLPGIELDLPPETGIFAAEWLQGDGADNSRRARISVDCMVAAESAILSSDQPGDSFAHNLTRRADRLSTWLEHASSLVAPLDQEIFQTAGAKKEIQARPAAFNAVRQRYGI